MCLKSHKVFSSKGLSILYPLKKYQSCWAKGCFPQTGTTQSHHACIPSACRNGSATLPSARNSHQVDNEKNPVDPSSWKITNISLALVGLQLIETWKALVADKKSFWARHLDYLQMMCEFVFEREWTFNPLFPDSLNFDCLSYRKNSKITFNKPRIIDFSSPKTESNLASIKTTSCALWMGTHASHLAVTNSIKNSGFLIIDAASTKFAKIYVARKTRWIVYF